MPQSSDEEPAGGAGPHGQTILGRYRVERTLGHGGMGEVLLAHDTLLDRRVALKRLRAGGGELAEMRSSILKEARRASQITDRHVAAIYDVLDLDDQVLLVMEHVDGMTLRGRMADPVPLEEFWDLALQCAEGVAAAHAQGVIHRDIKPENFMVTRDGQVKVLDFGIARRMPTDEGFTSTSTEDLSGAFAGTVAYMAPEAHVGGVVDERTDLFSLGVVYYELLTGRRPFAGPTYGALLQQVLNTEPATVLALNPAAGTALSDIVAKLLAKRPADRISTSGELIDRLQRARLGQTEPAPAKPVTVPRARRAPSRLAVVTAAVAAAVASAIGWQTLAAPALPRDRNVAVLAPVLAGGTDFDAFSVGCIELVNARLRRHTDTRGFQITSYGEGIREKVQSAADARKILGANLAIVTKVTQEPDVLLARLELLDTASGRRLASRTVQVAATRPFELLDGTYRAVATMLRLKARAADSTSEWGIHGAGTLRFHLQGLGRLRLAASPEDSRHAVADFELACQTEPRSAVARAGLASGELGVYLATLDTTWLARAERSAREAVALGPERPEPHRILASVAAVRKQHAEALQEFGRTAQLDPSDDESELRLARTYGRLGQPGREKETYLAEIARLPHSWQPWWWLGAWYYQQGEVDSALHAYRELIRRAPALYRGYSSLGGLLVLRGEYRGAIDTLKLSLAVRPTRDAFGNLGAAYFNMGRFADAVDAFNQSFQFGNAQYVSWVNLGDAYFFSGNRDEDANAAYAQALRLARDEILSRAQTGGSIDVMIPANMAVLFARMGQPDSARVYVRRAVSAGSDNPRVNYCAALTWWELHETDRAMASLAKSIQEGYPKVWVRDSPVFVKWRTQPGFRALVEEEGTKPQPTAARS